MTVFFQFMVTLLQLLIQLGGRKIHLEYLFIITSCTVQKQKIVHNMQI